MRVPQDVDDLMWLIAESPDPAVLDDFEVRYPAFTAELGRRIALLRSFKGAGSAAAPGQIPAFRLMNPKPAMKVGRKVALGLLFASALGATAATGYRVWRDNNPPTCTTESASAVVVTPKAAKLAKKRARADAALSQAAPEIEPAVPAAGTEVPKWEKPISLNGSQIKLHDALALVCASSGLKLELAPGLENPDITFKYTDRSAMEILKDMGSNFGFTVLEQSRGSVLVVPAVEQDQDEPAPGREDPTRRADGSRTEIPEDRGP